MIFGDSGYGKSTLIETIIGLLPVSRGQRFFGEELLTNGLLRSQLFYMPQNIILYNGSVLENITFGLTAEYSVQHQIEIEQLLADLYPTRNFSQGLSLSKIIEDKGKNLSGGERQRVILARLFYRLKFSKEKPSLIFLDEPTSSLDQESSQHIFKKLKNAIKTFGLTIVVITHDRSLISFADNNYEITACCKRSLVSENKKIV
jgi:ABC-type transport system involved in cytochrome bd biosynthesis fused ATPase/permease subunit